MKKGKKSLFGDELLKQRGERAEKNLGLFLFKQRGEGGKALSDDICRGGDLFSGKRLPGGKFERLFG